MNLIGNPRMNHTPANAITEASIAYVMMNENILLEDRLDYLKANTKKLDTSHDTTAKHQETPDIIQHFADNADPTKNKQHTQYIINLYKNKKIRQDDAPGIHDVLSNYEKYKGKLTPEDRQLSTTKYPRISDLQDKIAPHLGTMASKKQAEKTLEQPGHTLVHEDDKIKIYRLEKTKEGKEASKALYGGGSERGSTGTNWCTAARSDDRNYFDEYLKEGGRYHVIHRKSDGAVFQMHPQSNQFHDAKNNDISPEDFKSIAPSLHAAWEKHPEMLED